MKIRISTTVLLLVFLKTNGQWNNTGNNSTTGNLTVSETITGGMYQMVSNDGQTGFYIQKPTATGQPFSIRLGSQSISGGIMIGRTDWISKVLIPWNVGIGTITPAAKLDVVHTSNTDWATSILNNGGSGKGLLIKSASGNTTPVLQVDDLSGNNRFLVRSDGNIGIATSNPTAKLQVGEGTVNGIINLGGYANVGNLRSSGDFFAGTNVYAQYNSSAENSKIKVLNSNSNGFTAMQMSYNGDISFFSKLGSVVSND